MMARFMSRLAASLILTNLILTSLASGGVLHVGAGQTYSTIQAAWNAAQNGDTISVHAGTYTPTSSQYVLMARNAQTDPGKNNITIAAAGDGRVTLTGGIAIFGTTDGNMGNITIEGLYINVTGSTTNKSGIYLRADAGQTLQGVTVRNNVLYGDFTSAQAIYLYGAGAHGQHLIEHNTVYGGGATTAYGIRDEMDRSAGKLGQKPVIRSNIVSNANIGYRTWFAGYTFDYSDGFGNVASNFQSAKGATSIQVDPLFASTNPNDANFLYLSATSPTSVLQGAHDGTHMGALGLIPEPATLMIVGVSVAAGIMRRRH